MKMKNESLTHFQEVDGRNYVILVVDKRLLHRFTNSFYCSKVYYTVNFILKANKQNYVKDKTSSFCNSRAKFYKIFVSNNTETIVALDKHGLFQKQHII